MRRFALIAKLAACVLAAGCAARPAEDLGADTCGPVVPCGGDLAGIWEVDSECLSIQSPFTQPECQAAVRAVELASSGTISYTVLPLDPESGTMQPNFTYRLAADEIYSMACLVALGFAGGTAEACQGLELLWAGPIAVTCAPALGGCRCQFADEQRVDAPMDYTIRDGQIVFSPTDVVSYCRTGDSLLESAVTDAAVSRVALHLRRP